LIHSFTIQQLYRAIFILSTTTKIYRNATKRGAKRAQKKHYSTILRCALSKVIIAVTHTMHFFEISKYNYSIGPKYDINIIIWRKINSKSKIYMLQ
jgi:hypothetical protein